MKDEKKTFSQEIIKQTVDLGEEDQGGSGSAIEFHDFLSGRSSEERALSPEEEKRILLTHRSAQAVHIEKAKQQKENMKQFKNQAAYEKSQRAGQEGFPPNPRIANEAQFGGQDKKMNGDPSLRETNDDTNPGQKQALQNRLENKHRLTAQPTHSFTPSFKPPGT